MYLSRITLDVANRAVLRDLSDAQALHRTVMSGFPPDGPGNDPRAAFGVLHRLDEDVRRERVFLLVQSRLEPQWNRLAPGYALVPPDIKPLEGFLAGIITGQRLAFRLRANPTRKVGTVTKAERDAGQRGNGKRVPVRDDEREAWLLRKAEEAGFRVVAVTVGHGGGKVTTGIRASSQGSKRLSHQVAIYEGELLVEDRDRFVAALETGIGPAKAYGFGMLSVAPVHHGS